MSFEFRERSRQLIDLSNTKFSGELYHLPLRDHTFIIRIGNSLHCILVENVTYWTNDSCCSGT